MFQDAPDKLEQRVPESGASPVLAGLRSAMRDAQREIAIISPYFVPGEDGAQALVAGVRDGLRIRILTNSLASNDVAAVHGGYIRHRGLLARGGVELWELKPRLGREQGSLFGSSGARLHGKAAIIDGRTLFVGSLNLDPRSVQLNSEQGLLVTDPVLAAQLSALFDNMTRPENAWAIGWDQDRKRLLWHDDCGTSDREPDAGLTRRAVARLAYWLPIDPLL